MNFTVEETWNIDNQIGPGPLKGESSIEER